jgi:protein-tyrosine-phosphatase
MAEGIAASIGLPNLVFCSAGLDPKPVDADTIQFMAAKGIDISKQTSKAVAQVPNLDHYHVIIALSKNAKKVFPPLPTKTVALDWHTSDPSALTGSANEKQAAFAETYEYIRTHIQDLGEAILGDTID